MESISQLVTKMQQSSLIFTLAFLTSKSSETKLSRLFLLAIFYLNFEV